MAEDKSGYYKEKRDENLNNRPLAAFYQIFLVQEEENRRFTFRKRSTLTQLRRILKEMLDEVLQIDNADYQNGICLEVLLSGGAGCPSEIEGELCSRYFESSGIQEYVQGAYQIHINGIRNIAAEDMDAALMYAENLLKLLEMRYGQDSQPYARMKLHLIGEFFYWHDKEKFLRIFREDYDYFRQYAMPCDIYFYDALSCFIYCLWKGEYKDYALWLARYEEDLRLIQEHDFYCFYQSKIAYIKARKLEKERRNEDGLQLLEYTIQEYVEKDSDTFRLFYANIYLMAAYFSKEIIENAKMLLYAQKGINVCEKAEQKNRELYYNLYNYVGIWHMRENRWEEAEKLYIGAIPGIVQRFGKNNENFVTYMSNLAWTAANRGRDATRYYNEIKKNVSKELQNKFNTLINNQLNYSISRGDSIMQITSIYKRCLANLTKSDPEERSRLDTLYLSARIGMYHLFDKQTEELLKKLEDRYRNQFDNELAVLYWNSRIVWEWKEGRVGNALKIAECLTQRIEDLANSGEIHIVMNIIQLLIVDGQYRKAEEQILAVLDILYDKILARGFGNSWPYVSYIRMLVSMYIHDIRKGRTDLQMENEEEERLLEEIIRCKTIEREIKGLMGKCDDDQMDFYYFRQAHRKLAALEILQNAGKMEPSDYDKKKTKCLMELGEYESGVSRRIPFRELIHKYKFTELEMPHNTLCAEYFAYYSFLRDEPMFGAEWEGCEEKACSYLVFILGEDGGQAKLLEVSDISFDHTPDREISCLLKAADTTVDYSEDEVESIISYLYQKFALPVLSCAAGKERLYLGLDFILQLLPIDIIFHDERGEPVNTVLMDSICYVGEDTRIDMEKSDALIIGNPKLSQSDKQEEGNLPCGELECVRIAEMFGTKAYIGEEAEQKRLWGGEAKDVIHISAHGECSVSENMANDARKETPLICSFLKFAGYKDWQQGKRDKRYGNGVVTGDDFLFMDLSETKLVVLSACVSGLGYFGGMDTVHGLRWAISAAGAGNSITSLWSVTDEATAVLMMLFYRNLYSMPVGEALYRAKRRMRTITAAELKADKDLRQIMEIAQRDEKSGRDKPECDRPFAHWKYWAGFVCYHR